MHLYLHCADKLVTYHASVDLFSKLLITAYLYLNTSESVLRWTSEPMTSPWNVCHIIPMMPYSAADSILFYSILKSMGFSSSSPRNMN